MCVAKNAEISAMIINEYAKCGDIRAAYDLVLGDGAYEAAANEVYEILMSLKNRD